MERAKSESLHYQLAYLMGALRDVYGVPPVFLVLEVKLEEGPEENPKKDPNENPTNDADVLSHYCAGNRKWR